MGHEPGGRANAEAQASADADARAGPNAAANAAASGEGATSAHAEAPASARGSAPQGALGSAPAGAPATAQASTGAQAAANAAASGRGEAIRLVAGLPEKDLIRQIHCFRRMGEVGHRGLGFYLLELEKSGFYKPKAKSAAKWAGKELELTSSSLGGSSAPLGSSRR